MYVVVTGDTNPSATGPPVTHGVPDGPAGHRLRGRAVAAAAARHSGCASSSAAFGTAVLSGGGQGRGVIWDR